MPLLLPPQRRSPSGERLLDYAYYGNTISTPQILGLISPHASTMAKITLQLAIFVVAAVPGYALAIARIDRIGHRRLQRKLGPFIGVFLFPVRQTTLGLRGTLLLTAGVAVLGFALTFALPEPAGRSLEDIAVHIPAPVVGHANHREGAGALTIPAWRPRMDQPRKPPGTALR